MRTLDSEEVCSRSGPFVIHCDDTIIFFKIAELLHQSWAKIEINKTDDGLKQDVGGGVLEF